MASNLPYDTWKEIVRFLPADDVARVQGVSQAFCRVGRDNAIWIDRLKEDFLWEDQEAAVRVREGESVVLFVTSGLVFATSIHVWESTSRGG